MQLFLFTGVIYPESITNKDIAGIYKINSGLRVPMGFSNGKSQADGAEKSVNNLSERINRAYEKTPGPSSEKTIFRRDDLIAGDYLNVPKSFFRQIGIEDKTLDAQILVLPAKDMEILNNDPATRYIFKNDNE